MNKNKGLIGVVALMALAIISGLAGSYINNNDNEVIKLRQELTENKRAFKLDLAQVKGDMKTETKNSVPSQDMQLGAFLSVAGKVYYLYGGGIDSDDTTITLTAFKTPVSDYNLLMSNFGDIGYLTLEPGNTSRQEFVSFSGITQNSDGTATLTGVVRGLSPVSPYTASTTIQKTHYGGTIAVLSNPPQFYEQFGTLSNTETVSALWTFSSGLLSQASSTFSATTTLASGALVSTAYRCTTNSDNNQLCEKNYIDGVAVAGASNANTTTKGIVEEATASETFSGATTGSTGARLFVTPEQLINFASTTSYMAATSSLRTMPNAGLSTSITAATTTSIAYGQSMMIWASGTQGTNSNYSLNVKSTGQATTTIAVSSLGNTTVAGPYSMFGIYNASTTNASGVIEIYVSDTTTSKFRTDVLVPSFMYIRF